MRSDSYMVARPLHGLTLCAFLLTRATPLRPLADVEAELVSAGAPRVSIEYTIQREDGSRDLIELRFDPAPVEHLVTEADASLRAHGMDAATRITASRALAERMWGHALAERMTPHRAARVRKIGILGDCQYAWMSGLQRSTLLRETLAFQGVELVSLPERWALEPADGATLERVAHALASCDVVVIQVGNNRTDDGALPLEAVAARVHTLRPEVVLVRVPLIYLPLWPINDSGAGLREAPRAARAPLRFADDGAFRTYLHGFDYRSRLRDALAAFRQFDARGDLELYPFFAAAFARGELLLTHALHPDGPTMFEVREGPCARARPGK